MIIINQILCRVEDALDEKNYSQKSKCCGKSVEESCMEFFVPSLLYEIPYYVAADSKQSRDEYQEH